MPTAMDKRRLLCFKLLTLMGSFMLRIPDGGLWTWGNMSVYVLSHLKMVGEKTSTLEYPWIISIFIIAWSVSMLIVDSAVKVLRGRKLTLALGILLFDGGLFLSCYSIQNSFTYLTITQGLMTGLGYGLVYSIVLLFVVDWAENRVGIAFAIITSGCMLGNTITILFVTLYTNPHNETPNLRLGQMTYFTQIAVINKVPHMYLILSAFSVVNHVIGLLLLRTKMDTLKGESKGNEETVGENNLLQANYPSTEKYSEGSGNSKDNHVNEVNKVQNDLVNPGHHRQNDTQSLNLTLKPENAMLPSDASASDNNCIFVKANDTIDEDQGKTQRNTDYTPSEIFRQKSIYILWFLLVINDFAFIVLINYYKMFGQLFIENDHSLADLGVAATISVAITRILWGLAIDNVGVKHTLMIYSGLSSVLYSLYYFTPGLSPIAYYICCVLLLCADNAIHATFSIAVLRLFGQKNVAFNTGLVMSASVFNLVHPPVIRLILHHFGWFLLFFTAAAAFSISFFSIVLGLPKV